MNGDSILDRQAHLNRSTRGQWVLYSSHRQELERLLIPQQPGGSICVLGAGNCNDLDLRWMLQVYAQVTLVDIDGEALDRGAKFQKVDDSTKLKLIGGFDLTGIAEELGAWSKKKPDSSQVEHCIVQSKLAPPAVSPSIGGPFDVVVSPCVLSQLLSPLRDFLGEASEGFAPLLSAMRARHFRLMLDLLAHRGKGVFACDLFSSAVMPELPRVHKDRLPDLMRKMLAAERFFSGLDPATVRASLKNDATLAPHINNPIFHPPWLWHLGLAKSYLVYGMTFEKRDSSRSGGTAGG